MKDPNGFWEAFYVARRAQGKPARSPSAAARRLLRRAEGCRGMFEYLQGEGWRTLSQTRDRLLLGPWFKVAYQLLYPLLVKRWDVRRGPWGYGDLIRWSAHLAPRQVVRIASQLKPVENDLLRFAPKPPEASLFRWDASSFWNIHRLGL